MDISFLLWILLGVGLTVIFLQNQRAKQYWQGIPTRITGRVVPPPTQHPPAGPLPAGAHAPNPNPTPVPNPVRAAHGTGMMYWIKKLIKPIIIVTLAFGLVGLLYFISKNRASTENMEGGGESLPDLTTFIDNYFFLALGVVIILIAIFFLISPKEKKEH